MSVRETSSSRGVMVQHGLAVAKGCDRIFQALDTIFRFALLHHCLWHRFCQRFFRKPPPGQLECAHEEVSRRVTVVVVAVAALFRRNSGLQKRGKVFVARCLSGEPSAVPLTTPIVSRNAK